MKKILLTLSFVSLIVAAALGLSWYRFARLPITAATPSTKLVVDVSPGSNFFSIRRQLQEQGIAIDPFPLRLWIHLRGAGKRLRIGEYDVQTNWSRLRVLDEILSGNPVLHKFIVKEGHNIWDIEQEVRRIWGETGVKEFHGLIVNPDLLRRMGVPERLPVGAHRTLEGFLFPETYSYQKYDSPRQIVDAMLEQFERRALPLLKEHPWAQSPDGVYRLLTLASIVEKESGNPQEQPLVASVFWNRLKKHMKLQSDPTTIYALFPDFDGNLKKVHLLTPSAYNTYTLPELPAGPISNPGENALGAILHPATTNFLFFVGRNDGNHAFSADYKTHAAFVNQYQLHGGKPAARPTPVINPSAERSRPPSKPAKPPRQASGRKRPVVR